MSDARVRQAWQTDRCPAGPRLPRS
jgi:hypothetical protein